MLSEPWNTLLFILVIPLIQQAIKIWVDHGHPPLDKLANQAIALALTLLFIIPSGGFAGIAFPALPVFVGDLILDLSAVLTFVAAIVAVVGTAFGTLMALYEVVWSRLFQIARFVTADKLVEGYIEG